jgi:hypothetical protein
MMVVAPRKIGIPASLMTHSHYLTQCVLAIAGWRGLGLHETRKIQESRGTRNSPNMKIARTLIWWPRAADTLFGGLVQIGGEGFRRELMRRGVRLARRVRNRQDFGEECCGHFWEVRLSPSPGKVCSAPVPRGQLSREHGEEQNPSAAGSKFDWLIDAA